MRANRERERERERERKYLVCILLNVAQVDEVHAVRKLLHQGRDVVVGAASHGPDTDGEAVVEGWDSGQQRPERPGGLPKCVLELRQANRERRQKGRERV